VALPGIYQQTIFSGHAALAPSLFIRAMHPKTEIRPDRATIKRVLDAQWCGQLKIHGHRVQFHVPAEPTLDIFAYTRQGTLHKKPIPAPLATELRRLFAPPSGWNVVDGEWLKAEDRVFVFDFLKKDNRLLSSLTYTERLAMLPRVFNVNCIETLPIYRTVDKCLAAMDRPESYIEGLVFKSLNTPGFADTSIIRCRRSPRY